MADTDLQATFTANINPLKTNVAAAQDAVKAFADATQSGAARAASALRDMNAASKAASSEMIAGMSASGREATALAAGLDATGAAAERGFNTVSIRGRDVRNVMRGLTGGVEEAAAGVQSVLMNLSTRFVAANAALIPFAAAVAALGGTLAYFAVRAMEAKNALDTVQTSMRLGGAVDLTKEEINGLVDSLEKLPGVSYATAAQVVGSFANMAGASKPLMEGLTTASVDFAKATGTDVPTAAAKLRTAFENPTEGAKTLRDAIHAITPEQIAYIDQTARQGTLTQTQAALLQTLITAMRSQIQATRDHIQAQIEDNNASDSESASLPIITMRLEAQVRALDARNAALERSAAALRAQPRDAPANVTAGVDVNLNPQSQQLERINTQVENLQAALRRLGAEFGSLPEGSERFATLNAQIANVTAQLKTAREQQLSLNEAIGNVQPLETRRAMEEATATLERRNRIDFLKEQISLADDNAKTEGRTAQQITTIRAAQMRDRIELARQETELEVQQSNLRKTNAEGNSKAVLDAERASIAARRKLVAEGSAEDIGLQNELAAAEARAEDTATTIAQQGAESRHTIAINEITAREQLIREQGNSGRISRSEELSQLIDANTQRTAIDVAYFTKLRDLYSDDETKFNQYQLRLVEIQSESTARRAGIERQVGTQVTQEWDRHFQQVGQSVSSAVMGMIRGTTTLRQAFQSVALDIVQQFVSAGAKIIAQDAAVVAARLLGIETVKGAETAGAAGSILASIGQAMAKIGAGVGATIAGVTANQAPLTGPAAVGEGIAAGAAVEAAAVGALVLDTGAWQIGNGSTTPAFLHPGEMVLPGPSADLVRDALSGGGGGGNIHLHVSAVDGASVRRLFENNGRQLASVLRDVWKNDRSVRPAY